MEKKRKSLKKSSLQIHENLQECVELNKVEFEDTIPRQMLLNLGEDDQFAQNTIDNNNQQNKDQQEIKQQSWNQALHQKDETNQNFLKTLSQFFQQQEHLKQKSNSKHKQVTLLNNYTNSRCKQLLTNSKIPELKDISSSIHSNYQLSIKPSSTLSSKHSIQPYANSINPYNFINVGGISQEKQINFGLTQQMFSGIRKQFRRNNFTPRARQSYSVNQSVQMYSTRATPCSAGTAGEKSVIIIGNNIKFPNEVEDVKQNRTNQTPQHYMNSKKFLFEQKRIMALQQLKFRRGHKKSCCCNDTYSININPSQAAAMNGNSNDINQNTINYVRQSFQEKTKQFFLSNGNINTNNNNNNSTSSNPPNNNSSNHNLKSNFSENNNSSSTKNNDNNFAIQNQFVTGNTVNVKTSQAQRQFLENHPLLSCIQNLQYHQYNHNQCNNNQPNSKENTLHFYDKLKAEQGMNFKSTRTNNLKYFNKQIRSKSQNKDQVPSTAIDKLQTTFIFQDCKQQDQTQPSGRQNVLEYIVKKFNQSTVNGN